MRQKPRRVGRAPARPTKCLQTLVGLACARPTLLVLIFAAGALALPASGQDKKKAEKPAPPRVALIVPLGAAAGQTTKLTIRGMKLDDAKDVKLLDDKGTVKIVSKGKANVPDKNPDQVGDTQVVVEVTLKPKLSG